MNTTAVVSAVVGAVVCALLGGIRRRTFPVIAALATAFGVGLALVPTIAHVTFDRALGWLHQSPSPRAYAVFVFALSIFTGAYLFGFYLAALARFGLNHDQAFAALGHPVKHFVRFRVRADGSAIDAWVLGLVDPLGNKSPVLVDHLTFRRPSASL